jgi:hypothetical protein
MTVITDAEYIQALTEQNHELIREKEKITNLLRRIDAAITYESEKEAKGGTSSLPLSIASDVRALLGGSFNEYAPPPDALAAARADALREWFAALDDEAVNSWALNAGNEHDPKKMLADILHRAQEWALDPAISQAAAELVAAARQPAGVRCGAGAGCGGMRKPGADGR